MSNKQERKTIFVGLSGGVDSSVSAALLKEQGFDPVGAFISVWQPDWMACSQTDDRRDALRVSAHLNIPFVDIDAVDSYKQQVVDYMVEEYKRGRTPNPDIMCNKHVKFGVFFNEAMAQGADMIATGHYCRHIEINGEHALYKGVDSAKDQSYFLWAISQEQLKKTLFPIGEYEKPFVRELAEKFTLPTASKKDSQGLCFIGKLDLKEFLSHLVPQQSKGDVLSAEGDVIGHHDGALFFTIGQRHGFTITKKTPNDTPYYVIHKDIENNTITASQTPDTSDQQATIQIEQTNWIREVPKEGDTFDARFRYRQQLTPVTIRSLSHATATIEFKTPQSLVPSGQSLVLYKEDECIGGGIIT